jgi:hypothetical protein
MSRRESGGFRVAKLSVSIGTIGILGLTVLGLTMSASGQSQNSPVLARIELHESDDLARIEALDLPVLAYLTASDGDYLLAVLDADDQKRLQPLDLTWSVLDPDASRAVYYLLESQSHRLTERAASVFRVLYDDDRYAVGRLLEEASVFDVDALGVPVVYLGVDRDSIQLAPRDTGLIPTTPLYDPLVADMLTQVATTTVYSYDGGLSGEWPIIIGGQPYTLTTRYTYSGEPVAKATQYVYEHMQALGYDVSYHDYQLSGHNLRNVVGEKQGLVHPEQIFLLTAHLDSRAASAPHNPAPGADDNASGSTALLVTADRLADLDLAYTIRLVFFTGEEQGLYGSYYYARDVAAAGENIVGVINLDMIAWDAVGDPDIDLHSTTNPGVEAGSDALAELFAAVVNVYGLDLEPQIVENGATASDHSSFWNQGYPAILGIEDYYNDDDGTDFNAYYHTVNDRLSALNLTYFREYVRASLATFTHLAEPMRVLSGAVTDAITAAPVSATVTAVGQDGAFDDATDVSGSYEIVLPTGIYTVTASAPSHDSQTLSNVAILTGTGKGLNFILEPVIYAFDLLGPVVRFGEPGGRVTHTVTIVNTGVQSDVYDLALGPSTWTTTLPFTRSAVLLSQHQITAPLAVSVPSNATSGEQDQVTLTVTSVYSPTCTEQIVLRTVVGYKIYLPLTLRNFPISGTLRLGAENVGSLGFRVAKMLDFPTCWA